MTLLIKNGHVLSPANKIDGICDIFIDHGKISNVAHNIQKCADEVIDAKQRIVVPGLVDMHVHLRQPGREDKETVASGTKAALKGGVTSLLAMPNTQPAIDCPRNVKILKDAIKTTAQANVFIAGAITKERLGKKICDIIALKEAGAIAITDDGDSTESEKILLEALRIAKREKIVVISHCEDKSVSGEGVVNLGIVSTRLGLKGAAKGAEYNRVARDIALAEKADAPIHIAHLSCKESVRLIAEAKKKGIRVSAETAPHYFSFTDEDFLGYNTNMKINPPLRSREDVAAIKQGLNRGIIDVIASDHAPHTDNEKAIEFEHAEFGTIGLETILAASITELIDPGLLDWPGLVKMLSTHPAKILGINKGVLAKGRDADIIIVNAGKEWVVRKEDLISKSKNSAFLGRRLKGRVEYTILGGSLVYKCGL